MVSRKASSSVDSVSVLLSFIWTTPTLTDLHTHLKCPRFPHLLHTASFAGHRWQSWTALSPHRRHIGWLELLFYVAAPLHVGQWGAFPLSPFPWWTALTGSSGCFVSSPRTTDCCCLTVSACHALVTALSNVSCESNCSFSDKAASLRPTTILSLIISVIIYWVLNYKIFLQPLWWHWLLRCLETVMEVR